MVKAGLKVKVIEARNRTGGRVNTVEFDGGLADLGGQWIHGLGPGTDMLPEWEGQLNPIYAIAKEHGL